jgi:membrane protein
MNENLRIVKRSYGFLQRWYRHSVAMIRTGDPLLMGAAIAYNTLFALFPLALAFFTILTFFDTTDDAFTTVIDAINSLLPPDIAQFFTDVLRDSLDAVSQDRLVIVVVSILVALWSGSRAVYTVQKALRVVQGIEEHRGYIRARLTGIVVTIAGGTSFLIAYLALLIGNTAYKEFAELIGFGSIGRGQIFIVLVICGWIFLLLWVIYRYGPPNPFDHAAVSAAIVSAIVVTGTWAAQSVLPSFDLSSFAVFGTVGLVLVWLYCIGIVVVAIPVAVVGLFAAVDDHPPR